MINNQHYLVQYKNLLKEILDKRPSGIRQKLSKALGTHKSFISQIQNPNYNVPMPAHHLATLFQVCHFSQDEREKFLEIHQKAHGSQFTALSELTFIENGMLKIYLPKNLNTKTRNRVAKIITEFAEQVIALIQMKKNNC